MENNELLKRGEDLARRCENKCMVTNTGFLSPAEPFGTLRQWNLWQREKFNSMSFAPGELIEVTDKLSFELELFSMVLIKEK